MSRRLALSSEYIDALVASDVSACALRIAMLVARMQGRNEHAWPTVATIAERVGCDKRTVQRGVAELRKAGLLDTEERRGGRTFYSVPAPGADATPGETAAHDNDAGATGDISIPPPPAPTPPAGGVSIHSHLIQEDDQRSLIRGKGNEPPAGTESGPVSVESAPTGSLRTERRTEAVRAAFVDAFRAAGGLPPPWLLGLTNREWPELDTWLGGAFAGLEVETAKRLGDGFARHAFARKRGYPFRGSGGLIEGPGEFLGTAGYVRPNDIKHTATSDEDFEKAMGAR